MQIEAVHFGHVVVESAVEMGETKAVHLTSTSFLVKYCSWKEDSDGVWSPPKMRFSFSGCGDKYSKEVCFV
jgi:hypothetical protein